MAKRRTRSPAGRRTADTSIATAIASAHAPTAQPSASTSTGGAIALK